MSCCHGDRAACSDPHLFPHSVIDVHARGGGGRQRAVNVVGALDCGGEEQLSVQSGGPVEQSGGSTAEEGSAASTR